MGIALHDTAGEAVALFDEARNDAGVPISVRRAIHQFPELDFDLGRTAGMIEAELVRIGVRTRRCAGTGIVGVLRGVAPGRTAGLRADMDALPITESSGAPFASRNPGIMHACGHDIHIAGVLGAARLLSRRRERLRGNVVFLFQPAEETSGGALPMILDGAIDDPTLDAIFSFHCSPELPVGSVGMAPGRFRAASDMLDFRISGRGCHGAEPQRGIDVVVVAAHIVCALQHTVARMTDPRDHAVLTIGEISGGRARNVVADSVSMKGILRTLSGDSRSRLLGKIREIVTDVAAAFGAECSLTRHEGYPCLVNDPAITAFVGNCAADALGRENVREITEPSMGVDDFAYFLERVPGTYFLLGTASQANAAPLHSPEFAPDEGSIAVASSVCAGACLRFLREGHRK
jgi:amidohydrolase